MANDAFPKTGFVRLSSILAPRGPLPISRSTWFSWQREGRAPVPIRLSSRITAYRAEDVNEFISQLTQANSPSDEEDRINAVVSSTR